MNSILAFRSTTYVRMCNTAWADQRLLQGNIRYIKSNPTRIIKNLKFKKEVGIDYIYKK